MSDDQRWNRMVEQMNRAVTRSVEQNVEAQSRLLEAWTDAVQEPVLDDEELEAAVESYARAHEVWIDAAEEMADRIDEAGAGEDVPIEEFRDIWLQTANEAFKEVMGTTAFAAAMGDILEATTETQADLDEVNREILSGLGLSTRDDVEEVGERLVELERRQHEVERKLDRVLDRLEA
jgi:hypothetical protein